MAIFLKRDTKVYLEKTVNSVTALWEIPVMDGFNFSQANTTSEVTLNEMAGAGGYSKRGRRMFNDALAPAEWSFSTYIRPFRSSAAYVAAQAAGTGAGGSSNHHAIEEILWANFVGKAGWTQAATGIATLGAVTITGGVVGTYEIDQGEYTTSGSGFGATFRITVTSATAATIAVVNPGSGYAVSDTITIPAATIGATTLSVGAIATLSAAETTAYDGELENFVRDGTDLNIYSTGANTVELGTFNLYFVMGATNASSMSYTASSTLEIYKLTGCVVNEATINFEVDGIAMIDWSGSASLLTTEATFNAGPSITEGITSTSNFIRNKLTALTVTAKNTTAYPGANSNGVYNVILTGGSITLSNNITFLTPEVLGIVNQPIGHITGNKTISGNFTAYVDSGTNGDSGDLFEDMTSAAARSVITNSFNLTFRIGGATGTPRFEVNLPTAHMEIPTIQSEDVITIDVAFHGLPSTITQSDEFNLTYVGA